MELAELGALLDDLDDTAAVDVQIERLHAALDYAVGVLAENGFEIPRESSDEDDEPTVSTATEQEISA